MKNSVYIFLIFTIMLLSCDKNKNKILFSYKDILDKEFRFDIGRPVPITIEQAIETEGDISRDGMYMYYSSDRERGNFDIYLRSLSDIKTIRLTDHSSRDYSPAISPNGKILLFVSNREDTEGDIYSSKIDPEDILIKADSPLTKPEPIDSSAKNLTSVKNEITKSFFSYKDSSPSWSPDGKKIVFSSNRTGTENIWLMDSSGSNKKQITFKGGIHPKFSPDGKKIIFISYRDGSSGDIYEADSNTGTEKIILKDSAIKLYPGYRNSSNEITYTAIESDTNGDGRIDLNDNAVLLYRNLSDSTEYPLTLRSRSSFNSKWIPVFESQTVRGAIVYSEQIASNININAIPDTGVIPKRLDSAQQYYLAESYLNDYNDIESHLLGLEMVFHFYGKIRDKISTVYAYKALADAFIYYNLKGDNHNKTRILNLVNKFYKNGNEFSAVTAEFLSALNSKKNGTAVIENYIKKYKEDKNLNYYVPFLFELAASDPVHGKNKASLYYREIITSYKNYPRLNSVNAKYILLTLKAPGNDFNETLIEVLKKGSPADKINIKKHFIDINKTISPFERIAFTKNLKDKYKSDKETLSMLLMIEGEALLNSGNPEEAKKILIEAFNVSIPSDLLYYRIAVLLGDIFRNEKKLTEAEKYYYAAASRYRLIWKENNFRDMLQFLVDYYEESGERSENNGNYSDAVSIYEKYTNLMSYIHRLKKFEDVYNKYGSRAHVLYIDSYLILKGEKSIYQLEKLYQKNLAVARLDFDKAFIYGLAYIYTRTGIITEKSDIPLEPGQAAGINGLLENFKKADAQIDWSLFIDETFIDPYILKSWVYQYIDLKRTEDDGRYDKRISRIFSSYLLEQNIDMLDKAVTTNNESINPENEGNLHLNLANNYFLLLNFPRALFHYKESQKYKKTYGSIIEEAMLYYHLAYCYWQTGDNESARIEIKNALYIYETLSNVSTKYDEQKFLLMKYFALFNRMEKKYADTITWYEKLLALAEKSGLSADKARYYQEIAFCYKELNQFQKALSYLDMSDKLLQTYPDKEEKYYVQIRLFGLPPFNLYDLGQDTVVIGENKIFSSLGTKDKKLYSLSLREEIYSLTGNYILTVDSLNKKIEILKKKNTKTAHESMTATLNNSGFYLYKLKKYNEAKKQFTSAWEYATSSKINDLNGAFISIMNLVNLHAFYIETGLQKRETSAEEINKLIEKINSFRQNYEKNKFNDELKNLTKEADARKKKVDENAILNLKKKISEDADKVYYKIDIASGVLYYLKAELYDDVYKISSADENDAYSYIKKGTEIFSFYSEALSKFERAFESAENFESKKLYIKLLLNAAACYNRIGTYSKAYELYIDAKNNSEKYLYMDLMFSSYLNLADFLKESGSNVEGKDSMIYAAEYYQKALTLTESSPLFFAENHKKIEKLYDKYISLLVSSQDTARAFSISEKKYAYQRLVSIFSLNPSFSSINDASAYKNYILKQNESDSVRNKISKLLETGSDSDSKEIIQLNTKINEISLSIKNLITAASNVNPLLASYMQITSPDLNENKEAVVIKFHLYGNNISAWKINNGKVQYKTIAAQNDKKITEKISLFIGHDEKKIFIISDSGFNSVRKFLPADISFFLSPSFSRVKNFNASDLLSLKKILTSSKNLKDKFIAAGYSAEFTDSWDIDFANTSVIFDIVDNLLTPSVLFGKSGAGAVFIIKQIDFADSEDMMLFFESALYSGIRNILFISDINEDNTVKLLFDLNNNVFKSGNELKNSIASGHLKFKKVDPVSADTREKSSSIILKDAVYAFRSGNFSQAEILADKILSMKEQSKNLSVDRTKAQFLKALLKIETGDISGAEQLLKLSDTSHEYKEKALIDSLVLLNKNKHSESLKKFEGSIKLNSGLRGINTSIIYRSFLKISGLNDLHQEIISETNIKFKPTLNEKKLVSLLNNDNADAEISLNGKDKSSWLFNSLLYNKLIFINKIKSSASENEILIDKAIKNSEKSDLLFLKARLYFEKANLLKDNNLYAKSYDAYLQAEKNLSAYNLKWKNLQLSLAEIETLLDKGNIAAERLQKFLILSDNSDEDKTAILLMKTKIELLRIAKLKNPSVNDAYLFEKLFNDSMNYFIKDTGNIPVFKMKKLLFEILDAYINYKMRTGNHAVAVMYADFKKHISARSLLNKIPETPADIKTDKNESQLMLLSGEHPEIMLNTIFRNIQIETIQKKLSADSVIIYNIKNGKNIFSWIIGNNFKMALILENGFEKLKPVLDSYEDKITSLKNTYAESKALSEIFSPLEPYYKNKKNIYFITDNDLEKVPYEIMGSKVFLDESHKIYYISSLISAINPLKESGIKINLISDNCADLSCDLEKTAILESRFKVSSDGSICHLMSDIIYDPLNMSLSVSGIDFFSIIKSSDLIFASSKTINSIGYSNFSIFSSANGAGSVIISDPKVRDINSGLFADRFYKNLSTGKNVLASFENARVYLKSKKEFRHPAYWAAIRLYLNGL